jgi:hypothetical protein
MSGESGGIQKETAVVYLQVFNKTVPSLVLQTDDSKFKVHPLTCHEGTH